MPPTSTPFAPVSPYAGSIANLFIIVLIVLAVILVLVTGLITVILVRYVRRVREEGEPKQVFGSRRLEITWTVVPTLLLVGMFVLSARVMEQADPTPLHERRADIEIIGHQWWWEFRYLHSGVVTANELHLPVGRPLLAALKAADVIHDFWVPQLAPKKDMIPGRTDRIWLEADRPNTYLGACAEFCGQEHAWMLIRVIAQPPAEFDRWEQAQQRQAAAPSTDRARNGVRVYQQYACANCHQITGLTKAVSVGPDLTHVGSRQTLAGGAVVNTPDNMAAWLADPNRFKPESHMPNFHLAPDQVRDLAAFLESLK